jgi:hypothetical protein
LATFSPTDAAFEGFRITREKPQALMIWAVTYLVVSLVMVTGLITYFGPLLTELESLSAAAENDPAQAMALMQKMAPFYAVVLPVGLIVISVWTAAVYRIILRPEDKGFGYLKLGADELRLVLLTLIYVFLAMAFSFVVIFAAGLLAAAAAVAGGAVAGIMGVLIFLGVMAAFVFVGVRLSLAGPMTFAEQRLRVFGSWALTRGQFWRLLGAYVLSIVLALVVVLLGMVIYAATAAILVGGNLEAVGQVFQPDMTSVAAYFTPAMLIYVVFGAFLGAVQNAVVYAPAAVAYRQLNAGQPAS